MNWTSGQPIRICWPNPDRVCVQGGCVYCDDAPRRIRRAVVWAYAQEKGWIVDLEESTRWG